MKGLPAEWMHSKDELYENLRGPAKNVTVLATAFSEKRTTGPKENKRVEGTDRHEPMLMVINYGKGKIFHSTLGHMDYSMESVGFVTTLQRGAEWAATGEVTIPVPEDFPSAIEPKARKWGN
jgi:type 1 glutamine amidotransferase